MHVCKLPAAGEEICGGLTTEGPSAAGGDCVGFFSDAATEGLIDPVVATAKVDPMSATSEKNLRFLIMRHPDASQGNLSIGVGS